MKILHFYPKSDQMIAQYVGILAEGMRHSAEIQRADTLGAFKTKLNEMRPDIVHIHGCWQFALNQAAAMARKQEVRIVLSPHGQLTPWILKEKASIKGDTQSPTDVIGRSELLQRRTVGKAFAIIVSGKMECQSFQRLGWNPRIEVVHNSIITNSITQQEMCCQVFKVYQKVLDSNVLEQMSDKDQGLLAVIIKAGITGDKRWIDEDALKSLIQEGTTDWRRLLLYAEHENIRNYVDYGIATLNLHADAIDTRHIAAYFPDGYVPPRNSSDLDRRVYKVNRRNRLSDPDDTADANQSAPVYST